MYDENIMMAQATHLQPIYANQLRFEFCAHLLSPLVTENTCSLTKMRKTLFLFPKPYFYRPNSEHNA